MERVHTAQAEGGSAGRSDDPVWLLVIVAARGERSLDA